MWKSVLFPSGFQKLSNNSHTLIDLYRRDGQTQQSLARTAVKDKAAITRLLNGLEKKNIVLRIPDRNDKRSNLVYLTNKAKELKPHLVGFVEEMLDEAGQGIDPDEMTRCRATINSIFATFDRLNNPAPPEK